MEAREPVSETQGILDIWRSLRERERLGLSLTFPATCVGELEVVSNRGRGDENRLCAPHVEGQRPTAASLGEPQPLESAHRAAGYDLGQVQGSFHPVSFSRERTPSARTSQKGLWASCDRRNMN